MTQEGARKRRYVVGFRIEGRYRHVQLDATDALDAAQRVKGAHPEAHITYARRHNQRADDRHPEPMLGEERPIGPAPGRPKR
jgi:hypothetical protein